MRLNGMLTHNKIYLLKKIFSAENFLTKILQIFIKYLTFFLTKSEYFAYKLASFNAKVYTL